MFRSSKGPRYRVEETIVRAKLSEIVKELNKQIGDNLVAVLLTGSLARKEFSELGSNVNSWVVLKSDSPSSIMAIKKLYGKYIEQRIVQPVVTTKGEIEGMKESFPLLLHEAKKFHELLAGENFLNSLEAPEENLKSHARREILTQPILLRRRFLEISERKQVVFPLLNLVTRTCLFNTKCALYLREAELYSREELIKRATSLSDKASVLSELYAYKYAGRGVNLTDAIQMILRGIDYLSDLVVHAK